MKDQILNTLAKLHEEITTFTQELIRIPTENPPSRIYKECIQLIDRKLRGFDLDSRIIEVETSPNSSSPRFCLLAPSVGQFFGLCWCHVAQDSFRKTEVHSKILTLSKSNLITNKRRKK